LLGNTFKPFHIPTATKLGPHTLNKSEEGVIIGALYFGDGWKDNFREAISCLI
jgi:hypothetical protein